MGKEMENIDLTVAQRKEVIDLLKHYLPDTEVWAYGSRVKFTAQPSSDLDMVAFASSKQKTAVYNLREAFEESSLPFRVDMFVWDEVPEQFHKNIEDERVVLQKGETGESELPEGWKEITVGDVIITNDAIYSKEDKWKFINYLDTGNLTENHISDFQYLVVGKDKIPSRAKRKIQVGDIVYSTVRPNQKHYGILKKTIQNLLVSTGFVTIRAKKEHANTNFIYWFLVQPQIIEKLQTIGEHSTSTYPSIKPSDIERLKLNLPPLPEQRAIAHILGSLDDKIELNLRMNETLEAMAQALFKSWFVDFDPVIDKALAAGNEIPKELQEKAKRRRMQKDTRRPLPVDVEKLFPSDFEHTEEMGWIPKGWRVSTVGEEFNVNMGQSPPGLTYNETGEGIPFFQGRADFGFRYPSERVYCTEPKRFAEQNDTLVSVRAPVGDVNMAFNRCCIGRGVGAVRHKSLSRSYTYYAMIYLREHFNAFEAEGTVFGSINQKDFKSLKWIRSHTGLVEKYESLACQFDEKIEVCYRNILALTNSRDTLLPKLMSGEVRIPDSEKLMEKLE